MKRRLLMSFSLLICVVAGLIGAELDKDDLTVKVDIQKDLTVVCFTIDPYLTASAESAPDELAGSVSLVSDSPSGTDTRSITVYASARTNRNERLKLAVYATAMTLMNGDNYTDITVPTTINGTPVTEAASSSSSSGAGSEPVWTFTESEKAGSGLRAVLGEGYEFTGNSVKISAEFDSALEGTYQAVLYMVIQPVVA